MELLQTVGIALGGFGFFGMIVDSASWREYFGSRLREIVVDQSYLSSLDADTLKGLQGRILRALFKDPAIDREGSFLNYFHLNLHRYIVEPYREDVTAEVILLEARADGLKVLDRVTYVCRESAGRIQASVRWRPDPDEFLAMEHLKIEIQYPYSHEEKGKRKILLDKDLSQEEMKTFTVDESLREFQSIDRLIICVESIYTVKKDNFQYWQMAHPTKNFYITLSFPEDHTIQLKPFVLHPEIVQMSVDTRMAKVMYDSWMLPQSGIAWHFVRKEKAASEPPRVPA